jgi:hypothetical protein
MTPTPITNREHLEARQAETNREIAEFEATLPKEELVKRDAITQAIKILTDAGIHSYIFAVQKVPHHNEGVMIQYNNFLALAEFDNAGKPTNEELARNRKIQTSFWGTVFQTYMQGGWHRASGEQFNWEDVSENVLTLFSQGTRFNREGVII